VGLGLARLGLVGVSGAWPARWCAFWWGRASPGDPRWGEALRGLVRPGRL